MSLPTTPLVFDRPLLRQRRERAAETAQKFDFLLHDVAGRLAERLDLVKRSFPFVLDLGGAHGILAEKINSREGTDHVVSADLSYRLVSRARELSVVADEEFLPFKPHSFDAVLSNLSLQWVNDLPGCFVQIRQVLKPDGLFLGAMLGGESLFELRQSLMEAEILVTGGASPRVSPFADVRDIGGLLQRAGFALPVADSDKVIVDYAHPLKLMRDLRGMGAGNATYNRLMKPTRKAVMMEAVRIYQKKFMQDDGTVPATFQVIYATGWMPHDSQQKPLRPGSARIRLADALKTTEIPAGEKTV